MDLIERAKAHAALGDPRRLAIVDRLALGDLTVAELAELSGMAGNLIAHHLDVLEGAGLLLRRVSEGDHRRRYVTLRREGLPGDITVSNGVASDVVFVCSHNSARSQFAAALWEETTGEPADSAGSDPGRVVHPKAVKVAAEFGLDISEAQPKGYEGLQKVPGLVVSVCDRAYEGGVPVAPHHLHWSVPDPVRDGSLPAFRRAFSEIFARVENLARDTGRG